jgi:beta-phosphoglucomutase
MIKAIIFDLNGTMIDDMEYHTNAWYEILNKDLNADLSVEQVRKEMYGKNSEVLVRVFGEKRFTADEMNSLSIEKEKRYQKAFLPNLKLIEGLDRFLVDARSEGIKLAIASAAITFNIDFVLDNLGIRNLFSSIVSADDVVTSKPHPETFLKAAAQLEIQPADCIVFEDAPKGVEAAENAGMRTVVLTTMHQKEEFERYGNVVAYIKDYTDPFLKQLLESRREM